jgi:hypothetical protein
VELFAAIAEHFRAKVQFPPEVTDGIADEQYVRNVVDSLYRPSRSPGREIARKPDLQPASGT